MCTCADTRVIEHTTLSALSVRHGRVLRCQPACRARWLRGEGRGWLPLCGREEREGEGDGRLPRSVAERGGEGSGEGGCLVLWLGGEGKWRVPLGPGEDGEGGAYAAPAGRAALTRAGPCDGHWTGRCGWWPVRLVAGCAALTQGRSV